MRKFWTVLLAFVIVLLVATPIHAQELPPFPAELPGTADAAVSWVAVFLAGLTGLLATTVTDVVKQSRLLARIFSIDEKEQIGDAYANLVSIVASALSGLTVGYLAVLAGLLDESGVWQLILFTWPAAKGWFETANARRALAKK